MDKRALYNLLRLNYQEDEVTETEKWQVEDYRLLSDRELFDRLYELNISLDRDSFLFYVENSEDPEDLAALLAEELIDPLEKDKVYLPTFELWRRLAADRRSLSLFCDEFDRRVELYDVGALDPHFSLEDHIYHLQRFLEENEACAPNPQALFTYMSDRMANDVESFLYEYISDQIEMQNGNYALDLVEGFERFVTQPKWFHLLRAKIAFYFGLQDTDEMMGVLLNDLRALDLEFGFEMLDFCLLTEKRQFVIPVAKQMIKAVETERDFQEFLIELLHFFQYEKLPEAFQPIQQILDKRAANRQMESLRKDDPDLHQVMQILIKATPLKEG